MEDDMRQELMEYFDRTVGSPPAGAGERVIAGFRASVGRPGRRRLEWAPGAAAVALALLVVGALVLSRLGPRLQTAGRPEAPEPRGGAAVAYDASRHVLVLFGGRTDDQRRLHDTWTWDGTRWTRHLPGASPPSLAPGWLMAYDAADGTVVLYGDPAATWTWDGRAWSEHGGPVPPGQPEEGAMAYDPGTRTVLLYAKDAGTHATWSWDGRAWRRLHPATVPELATGAMASAGQGLLLVGTRADMVEGQFVTETWTWDGSDWSRRSPAVRLPLSPTYSLAYDEARGRLVAFVVPGEAAAAETWTWDGSTWGKEHPPHLPTPRLGGALVYDRAARAVVLYGGAGAGSGALDDLWTWDGSDWTLRKEATR